MAANDDRRPDLFENLEDAEGVPFDTAQQPPSDEELRQRGLQPVRAYVRTKASKAAQRAQRHREAAAQQGHGQVNVVAPQEAKGPLRELATAMREGRVSAEQVTALAAPSEGLLGPSDGMVGAGPSKRGVRPSVALLAGLVIGLIAGAGLGLTLVP